MMKLTILLFYFLLERMAAMQVNFFFCVVHRQQKLLLFSSFLPSPLFLRGEVGGEGKKRIKRVFAAHGWCLFLPIVEFTKQPCNTINYNNLVS